MCLGDAASAGSRDDKLSVIGGKLGSATNSGGGGAFADSGSGDESEHGETRAEAEGHSRAAPE